MTVERKTGFCLEYYRIIWRESKEKEPAKTKDFGVGGGELPGRTRYIDLG